MDTKSYTLSKTTWTKISDGTKSTSVQLKGNSGYFEIYVGDTAPTASSASMDINSSSQILPLDKAIAYVRGSGKIVVITV